MDHLPLPKQALPFSAPVFYLVKTHRVDRDTFRQHVTARPVDLLQIAMGSLSTDEREAGDIDTFVGAIQDWLYFGLLASVFDPFTRQDFIANDETYGQVVTSARLPAYMGAWEKEMASLPKVKIASCVKDIEQAIEMIWRVCDEADATNCGDHLTHWLVVFSVRILVTSLGHMIQKFDHTLDLLESFRISATKVDWKANKIPNSYRPLVLLMSERLWCPAEIVRMLRTYHCSTVWYMIGLKDHTPRCEWTNPSSCLPDPESSLGCITRQMKDSDYTARHVTPDCTCASVRPDMAQVSAILRDGGLPLIRCTVTDSSKFTLKVVRAKRNQTHIAISHVYSNGIAIPGQNQIFECQLMSLFGYMVKAHERSRSRRLPWVYLPRSWRHTRIARRKTLNFWIDTFCIPWSASSEQELWSLRKKAISLIEPVFAGAYAVIIADTSLRTLEPSDRPIIEISARIAISSWMTRSWTFLEAAVRREVPAYLCVGSQLISLDKVMLKSSAGKELRNNISRMLYTDLQWNFINFGVIWCYEKKLITQQYTFITMWNVLADRTTSQAGAEWGILAALLGYSMGEVLSLSKDQRPQAVLRGLERVPTSFFFKKIRRSPHLDDRRSRWLPTSIDHTIRASEGSLLFTDEGIHLDPKSALTLLVRANVTLAKDFVVYTTTNMSRHGVRITLHNPDLAVTTNGTQQVVHCLVLHHFGREDAGFSGSQTRSIRGEGACLLVQDTRPDGRIDTEFASSLSWEMVYERPPDCIEASITGQWIIISCGESTAIFPSQFRDTDPPLDRRTWYLPKFTRQKNLISLPDNAWLIWYTLPLLPFLGFLGVIPASSSHYPESAWIAGSVIVGVFLLEFVFIWLTLQVDKLFFTNWVNSFDESKTADRFWKRIMP